jgi:hypothetical protein
MNITEMERGNVSKKKKRKNGVRTSSKKEERLPRSSSSSNVNRRIRSLIQTTHNLYIKTLHSAAGSISLAGVSLSLEIIILLSTSFRGVLRPRWCYLTSLRGFKNTTPLREAFTSSASAIVSLRNRVSYAVLSDELVRILSHSFTERNVDDRNICLVYCRVGVNISNRSKSSIRYLTIDRKRIPFSGYLTVGRASTQVVALYGHRDI